MGDDQPLIEELEFVSRSRRRQTLQEEVVENFTEDVQAQVRSISRTLQQGDLVDREAVQEFRARFAAFDEFLSLELYAIGDLDPADFDTLECPPVEDQL